MSIINSISNSTKDAIKRKSAYSLPNRPSEQGMKPDAIKKAFWQPIVDVTNSALAEIERVINEINLIFATYDAHIANKSNPHEVTKSQLGLGNCDNTADVDKPVSTPQMTALNNHNSSSAAHSDIRNSITNEFASKVNVSDIKDDFISMDTNKPLSAYRGKLLYDSLEETNEKAELAVQSITLDSSTGILTITKTNGTISNIDLPLEYMVEDGYYDSTTKNIVLELAGGTTIDIPAAALVNEYFGDESTIVQYIDYNDDNKVKFKLNDTYKTRIDSNYSARHIHANRDILDSTSEAFTDELKATYDGYASSISAEVTNRQSEIERVEGLIDTTITTDTTSGSKVCAGLNDTEYRYTHTNGISALTLSSIATPICDYSFNIIFKSGSTATTFTNTLNATFIGDDTNNGVFTPTANVNYQLSIWYNGIGWYGSALRLRDVVTSVSITLNAVNNYGDLAGTSMKIGSAPTSANDYDYYAYGISADMAEVYPYPNNPIEIEGGIVYLWGYGYKINNGSLVSLVDNYTQATVITLSENDTLTLITANS